MARRPTRKAGDDGILRPSVARQLGRDKDGNVRTLVAWFYTNFADPKGLLRWDDATGDYEWLAGRGPFDAREELTNAFGHAALDYEFDEAIKQIEKRGIPHWTVSTRRIVSPGDDAPDMGRSLLPRDPADPHGDAVVETILYPVRDLGWSLRATFVPGTSNSSLGHEMTKADGLDLKPIEFKSVRELVIHLLKRPGKSPSVEDKEIGKAAIAWIRSLKDDAEIFTDQCIVVHGSPLGWLSLRDLTGVSDSTAITVIAVTSPSFHQGAILMLAYGGSRVFLRLVRNVNYLQDAFFERVQRRIRRSDWKPFKD